MKSLTKITLLAVSVLLHLSLLGQTYTFSTYQQEYNNITVGFPLTEGVWDDPDFVVPIGYGFTFYDQVITELESVEAYSTGGIMIDLLEGNFASVLGVFGPDIIDRGYYVGTSMSAILFAYAGTPGQRVYIQEWLNVGFANGDTVNGVYTDFINFQLQLHEASGDIIFHFGPSSITNPTANYEGNSGPAIGLLRAVDLSGVGLPQESLILTGNPANPTVITKYTEAYLNGSIPPNTVYRFTQGITSLDDQSSEKSLSIFYPNPVSGPFWIREQYEAGITFPVQLFSSHGVLVREYSDPGQLDVYNLSSGIYQLRFRTERGWNTERILVMN